MENTEKYKYKDSFQRASENITRLQDEKMTLRLALGKLLSLCENTKMQDKNETWHHFMGVAKEALAETDINRKYEKINL